MSNKFWDFVKNDTGERVLRLEGPIDEESFWGNEITPKAFREELEAEEGDLTVWLNSPGGSVFAAAEIYTMLCDYKGKVTVKIEALAASAASVVAMAGDKVLMSPVAMLMIHDPMSIAVGNAKDMEKMVTTLNEIKESLINAYQKKSGLSRNRISKLMSDETWLDARKSVELGFADEVLFSSPDKGTSETEKGDKNEPTENVIQKPNWQSYSAKAMEQAFINRLVHSSASVAQPTEKSVEVENTDCQVSNEIKLDLTGKTNNGSVPYEILKKQLDFLE